MWNKNIKPKFGIYFNINSSLTYYILRQRELNFLIKNENPLVPKIIEVTLYLAYSYKVNVLSAKFEENNKNFTSK